MNTLTPDSPKTAAVMLTPTLRTDSADFIEYRRDSAGPAPEALFERPVIYTYRTPDEGGCAPGADLKTRLADSLAAAPRCAYVDIEASAGIEPARLLREKTRVIRSRHDFEGTPDPKTILSELEAMLPAADAVKAAYSCRTIADTRALAVAGRAFHDAYPDTALILIGMGAPGKITRVLPELFGSCLSYVAPDGQQSAPGQLSAQAMRALREALL